MNIGAQIVSKLGSPNSKIPLAVKDVCNCAGYTYFSYDAGGKVEGKDRFVDEVGTGALWLFGIPAYKKLIDKTIFKHAKIDPEIDVRILKDKNYFQKAIENAPTKSIQDNLKKAGDNALKTKKLNILKFVLSLGLTMLSYFGLTKFKQEMTKKNIEKEFLKNKVNLTNNKTSDYSIFKQSDVFDDFNDNKSNKTPSFGSNVFAKVAEDIMLNPVKNMMVLDMGISAERLSGARTKGEFAEYAIKEGSFLFFIYGADKLIKKGINCIAEKLFKAPINLDVNFVTSDYAKDILRDSNLQKQIKTFGETFTKGSNTNEMYDFILKNQTHPVVEAAKKSGIIKTIQDKSGNILIDTRKYTDPKDIHKLTKDLSKFIDMKKTSKQTTTKYLNKIKGLKVASTIMNIGICCFAIGYIVPKAMYKYREKQQNGKSDFHVRTEYEKELEKKHSKTL